MSASFNPGRSASAPLAEDMLASYLVQRIFLQVQILVGGRYPGIAYEHVGSPLAKGVAVSGGGRSLIAFLREWLYHVTQQV